MIMAQVLKVCLQINTLAYISLNSITVIFYGIYFDISLLLNKLKARLGAVVSIKIVEKKIAKN